MAVNSLFKKIKNNFEDLKGIMGELSEMEQVRGELFEMEKEFLDK